MRRKSGAYDAHSSTMSNAAAFFICSSIVYLFSTLCVEPYSREKLKENQPDYYQYLQTLFGPTSGTYQGSLNATPAMTEAAQGQ